MADDSVLYKYRAVNDYSLKALRKGQCWFASRYTLNDVYDAHVRLPKAISDAALRELLLIVHGRSYSPSGQTAIALLQAIETASDSFLRLGLMAEYAEDRQLLEVLCSSVRNRYARDILWFGVYGALSKFFDATAILCLSESPLSQTMWAYYADSHRGFCIGYRPLVDHPLYARLRPVTYSNDMKPVDFASASRDPVAVRDQIVCRKSVEYANEKEWRVTVTGPPALLNPPLEIAEIIFGAAMQSKERTLVADVATPYNPRFREVRPAYKDGYDFRLADCHPPNS